MVDEDIDRFMEAAKSKEKILAEYYQNRPEKYETIYHFGLGKYSLSVFLIYES